MVDQSASEKTSIEEEAARWAIDFENLSLVERAQFNRWLKERPENSVVFERMKREWRKLDALQDLATTTRDSKIADGAIRRRRWRRYTVPIAAAAAAAALSISVWVSLPSGYEARYRTIFGQQQEIILPDKSAIRLNTNSALTIRYRADERLVKLERGEAHFTVTPAPSRPFSVFAREGRVRAIGTAFNVYLKDPNLIEVTVTEGAVEFVPKASSEIVDETQSSIVAPDATSPNTIVAGQKLEYGETFRSVSNVDPEEIARKLAWQDGMLHFEGETLAEVIAEASRYTTTQIIIEDSEIAGLHVSGFIRAGDLAMLLDLIDSNEQVTVRRVSPGEVRIQKAKPLIR